MNNEQTIDNTVTNNIEIVDTVGLLKKLLSQENVGQKVRIYLGARYDHYIPTKLGGRWTLVDNYVFGKHPDEKDAFDYDEINESIREGVRAKAVAPGQKFITPFTIDLVMYRTVGKNYVDLIAPHIVAEAPYLITDDRAAAATHDEVKLTQAEGAELRIHHAYKHPLTLYKKK